MAPARLGALLVGLGLAVAASAVRAQDSGEPGPQQGLRLGGALEVRTGYDDNVFATRNDREADGVWVLAPRAELGWRRAGTDLRLGASAEIGRYWTETSEHYDDARLEGALTQALGDGEVIAGLSHAWEHEPRTSPDGRFGLEPTRYTESAGNLGYARDGEGWRVRVGATAAHLNFDDVPTALGELDNDDRDRALYTAGARVGRALDERLEVFGQVLADVRRYDQRVDDFGRQRRSAGGGAALGLRYREGAVLDVEGLVGALYQRYDDPAFSPIATPDFGLSLSYRPTGGTRVLLDLARDIEETTDPRASAIVATRAALTVQRLLRPDLSLYAGLDYTLDDYRESRREEATFGASTGLRYYLTPQAYVGASYRYEQRDSTVVDLDYESNQLFFNVGLRSEPAFAAEARPGFVDPAGGGFYVGGELAIGVLQSEVEGDRGSGGGNPGVLTADYANIGPGGGLFAGYATFLGNWRIGLEMHADLTAAGWAHAGNRERDATLDRTWSVGVGPVVGYRLPGGAIAYGRLGLQAAGFDYESTNPRGVAFAEESTLVGFRVGGGLEVPIGGPRFVRLEYSYTGYPDLTDDLTRDDLATAESTVRIGLGHRFGAAPTTGEVAPAAVPKGAYVGVQAGIGSLLGTVEGERNAGTARSEAGDTGFTGGLFGGYGWALGRLYLGGEVQGELARQRFDQERTGARAYAVDKRYGAALSARVGVLLDGASLLYLRGGPAAVTLRTDYTQGTTRVRQDDTKVGWHAGLGVEVPVSDRLFLRADYTYAQYGEHEVLLQDGRTERFDTAESTFRVGVGWRF